MYHHFDETRPIKSLVKSTLKLWPFVILASLFLGFVVINGGVVLGDQSAHQAKPHFAQLLYFLAFCAFHAAPQALSFLGELISTCFTRSYAGICALFFVLIG